MNCNELHAYLDAGVSATPPAAVRAHLSACPSCRRQWALAMQVAETLRTLPRPAVPAGFAERALAAAYRGDTRRQRWVHGWSLAIAAVFVLGLAIGVALRTAVPSAVGGYTLQDGTVVLQADGATTVRIALDAGRAVQNVDFVIRIPEGMELEGHPGEQEVAWRGELKQGRNVLGLPLIAKSGASGTLEAELHQGERNDVLKVRVMAAGGSGWWNLLRRAFA